MSSTPTREPAGPPTGQPTGSAPTGGQPAGGQPAGGEPAGGQPAGGQPAGGRPAAGQPAGGQSWLDRLRAPVDRVWNGQRDRRPWLAHLARGYRRYTDTRGNYLAAAITYFSFLALFPLLLLGVSAVGYVLAHNQDRMAQLIKLIQDNVPGSVGQEFTTVVTTAVDQRGTIGLFSLLGIAYAGLGWIGNLRTGLQLVWACEPVQENPIKAKLEDLLALVGLGLAIAVSLALTAFGTAAAHAALTWLGLSDTPGMGTIVRVLGLLLATAADTLVFAWLFVRLPRRPVRYGPTLRGAVFTAVGYELLKIVATVYLARLGANGVYGSFLSLVGLLIWLNLVARFLLFGAAWTATAGAVPPADTACDPQTEPPR